MVPCWRYIAMTSMPCWEASHTSGTCGALRRCARSAFRPSSPCITPYSLPLLVLPVMQAPVGGQLAGCDCTSEHERFSLHEHLFAANIAPPCLSGGVAIKNVCLGGRCRYLRRCRRRRSRSCARRCARCMSRQAPPLCARETPATHSMWSRLAPAPCTAPRDRSVSLLLSSIVYACCQPCRMPEAARCSAACTIELKN